MTLTHFGTASERAKRTGKPHIWWDGAHWNAVRPDGYSGHLAATPDQALKHADGGPEFFRRLEETSKRVARELGPASGRLMFR